MIDPMLLRLENVGSSSTLREVNMRCPGCRREATMRTFTKGDAVGSSKDRAGAFHLGHRWCPNPECQTHVFVVLDYGSGGLIASYPPETIDFDATDLPAAVVEAFEEAIKCHAQQCWVAAAIMVRKTLEEVCHDRGAEGKNLSARIQALGSKVVLPQELLDGLDDLRLLGNDAAHIESRVFNDVGSDEVEVAIDVTKEILKATYQYGAIMGRLRALKANP
jgi:hypothetical protein